MIIRLKIDVTKIDKSAMFKGAKGTYMDVTLLENEEPDQYGNDFMAVQDIGKERREAGERGPILGNAKFVIRNVPSRPNQAPQPTPAPAGAVEDEDDDIPF